MVEDVTTKTQGNTNPSTPGTAAEAKVPHRWRNLATLTGVMVVDNTEASATNSIFPAIASSLHLDSGHLGIMTAAGKVLSAPFGPIWVKISDKIGRKATLVLTGLFGALFGAMAGFANGWTMLLISVALMSASVIGAQPIVNAVIADSFDDKERGKASGILYGSINGLAALVGPALAQFTGIDSNGWRYAMWTLSGIMVVASIIVIFAFKDPGVGASDIQVSGANAKSVDEKPTMKEILGLFKIPSYTIMMISRFLSGHLLIPIFGIQFLVLERGFTNATASMVLLPFGIGAIVGNLGGGWIVKWLDVHVKHYGRIGFIQFAQLFFALGAFLGTQFMYDGITVYGVFWFIMGLSQGLNPPVNRPIVASVVHPRLRGQAYAIWLTIFETIAWAIFSVACGQLADFWSIQTVFLYITVGLLVLNAILLAGLYKTYPKDVRRVEMQLEAERA
ncbi:MFS transporter [Bifidobacterium margollesii]|uniref:MFS transporter n=1 Tax=Bifidobacterium margollesii TaxID=2020964 RepID=A0A2N5JAN0_9BIFI|nr:MFS transporter [Bifidobacterium margollesii]